jgi:hypothetical protein
VYAYEPEKYMLVVNAANIEKEYRTFGVVPYYMVQGKTLYKESDILKILEDSYKRCREEQRWV